MASPDDPKGEHTPSGEPLSHDNGQGSVSYHPVTDQTQSYGYYDDSYPHEPMPDEPSPAPSAQPENLLPPAAALTPSAPPVAAPPAAGGGGKKPPKSGPPPDEEDEEEEGMLRMSFLGHLEELRKRIFYMLGGIGVAFVVSLTFSEQLWNTVSQPARAALTALHINPPNLAMIEPMESFNVIWFKLPTLVAIFLSSPWILYQVWAFISPGLYKRERRFAVPFVLCSAGLFILGGLFAYFVAFRFALTFLLGLGASAGVTPVVSISEYFNLFVNVTLGIGVVFELPVVIFFLTLLRIVTPSFLMRHSRYAILGIVILAAVITPTPDIFNMMLFATPMLALYYVGVFASWILVMRRENRKLPWTKILLITLAVLLVLGAIGFFAMQRFHYHFVTHAPFIAK